jgi:ubiquinone/menaquinone biosynthesis C-methylase UbiE
MGTLEYDDQATRRLLAVYTTPDVVAQREALIRVLGPRRGERVLDVGSGPGFLASAIADAVGEAGAVSGIDISEPLNAIARAHCKHQAWVEIRRGSATQLPFSDACFDAAISTQVLEYVEDVDAAIGELLRIVRSGGRVVIVDTDWDSIVRYSHDPERMKRILAAWEQHAPHPRLPRSLARRLRQTGFRIELQQVLPLFNPSFADDSYSNRVIDLILSYVTDRAGISLADATMWAQDLREAGKKGDYFFSLNRYAFLAIKP